MAATLMVQTMGEMHPRFVGHIPRDLTDIDGVGLICVPCFERDCPPQFNYVWKLLGSKKLAWSSAWLIARFAYPVCEREAESAGHPESGE